MVSIRWVGSRWIGALKTHRNACLLKDNFSKAAIYGPRVYYTATNEMFIISFLSFLSNNTTVCT